MQWNQALMVPAFRTPPTCANNTELGAPRISCVSRMLAFSSYSHRCIHQATCTDAEITRSDKFPALWEVNESEECISETLLMQGQDTGHSPETQKRNLTVTSHQLQIPLLESHEEDRQKKPVFLLSFKRSSPLAAAHPVATCR